ncbi:antitoxin protein of toxin-antitoxin system [Yimella lutea]|uniref:Antitoxin protein of toxin-antitoxin system n=1 Tax=Yimella lutea TaxID=587872 RepID=A0A542EKI3_9MICO|nr:antitoxin [Yimella lutea]TQJ15847.1 antitoxin protein of toxin-antitoxin system [Yimella lutea]
MGLGDNLGGLGDKAKDLGGQHSDKVDQAIEKGGDFVDDKTGGQHAEHVDKGQDFARDQFGGGDQGAGQDGQGGEQQ